MAGPVASQPRKANKFSAKVTFCRAEHRHASKREARRCDELHLLLRAGEIESLEVEPQFWFVINGVELKHANGRRVGYKPDFAYTDRREAVRVVEDVKSGPTRTEAYVLRATLFRALFPDLLLREV